MRPSAACSTTLDAQGLTESTLVVFMSDNGMNCGHHGIWGKGNGTSPQNMYDTSVKVPCIVAQPGRIPAGRVSDALLSGYDMFPTLARLPRHRRTTPAASKPGRSFRAILEGEARRDDDRRSWCYDEYGPGAHGAHARLEVRAPLSGRTARAVRPRARSGRAPQPRRRCRRRADASARCAADSKTGSHATSIRSATASTRVSPAAASSGCVERGDPAHPMFADQHLVGADWDLWVANGERKRA